MNNFEMMELTHEETLAFCAKRFWSKLTFKSSINKITALADELVEEAAQQFCKVSHDVLVEEALTIVEQIYLNFLRSLDK